MHPIDSELLSRGLTYADYRQRISRNVEIFDEVYVTPAYHARDIALLRRLPPLRIVAIGASSNFLEILALLSAFHHLAPGAADAVD